MGKSVEVMKLIENTFLSPFSWQADNGDPFTLG